MRHPRVPFIQASLPFALFAIFMALLWVAGGASRGDALGQTVVRAGACAVIVIALLRGLQPDFGEVRPILYLLFGVILVPLAQIMPLPPAWWTELPGREPLPFTDQLSVWRPMAIAPGATLNALFSLIIPAATVFLVATINKTDYPKLLSLILFLIVVSVIMGLTQYAGLRYNNPLINDVSGSVSGVFANRNHFALLIAAGCIFASCWAFLDRQALRWRIPVAGSLVILFVLMAIATGSRSGLLLIGLALILSIAIVGNQVKQLLSTSSPWVFLVFVSAMAIVVTGFVALSFFADRVEAFDRLFALSVGNDLRIKAQPTIFEVIWVSFPWGVGVGGFDSAFRIVEPHQLLGVQYFNQAHNDYLGVAVDAGLPGLLLMICALTWWAHATIMIMRARYSETIMFARLGSGLLLLVFVASVTDYPVRTPIFMAITALAGVLVAYGSRDARRSALPQPASDV